jgi:hypothetical protein
MSSFFEAQVPGKEPDHHQREAERKDNEEKIISRYSTPKIRR